MVEFARLLVIEDDVLVREGIVAALTSQGGNVRAEADGTDLDAILAEFRPDIALLDVSLPTGPDGFELAARIRAVTTVPVIFITARTAMDDRIRGFEGGGDDYLCKPFAMRELLVRVRAVLRRAGPATSSLIHVRDVVIDTAARRVDRAGAAVALTPTEFDLLTALARTRGRPWSKRELLKEVWGLDEHAPHLVEVQISQLRRKLEVHGPRLIITGRDGSYGIAT